MKTRKPCIAPLALLLVVGNLVTSRGWPPAVAAQDKAPDSGPPQHPVNNVGGDQELFAQLRKLKAKTAMLEASLENRYPSGPAAGARTTPAARGTGMMGSGDMGTTRAGRHDRMAEAGRRGDAVCDAGPTVGKRLRRELSQSFARRVLGMRGVREPAVGSQTNGRLERRLQP